MKMVFLDAEFTGEHAKTTLVSIGLVGAADETLSVHLNDYDADQVTPWLEDNVLQHIDAATSVSRREAYEVVADWFDRYSGGEIVSIVSAGKLSDILLLFELWHEAFPGRPYFHHLHCLPDYLNHAAHFDLPTIFFLAGIDPNVDREALVGRSIPGPRHEALHDALVVRECYRRCVNPANFPALSATNHASL